MMGSLWTRKNGGHLVWKMQFQAQICTSYVANYCKMCKFLKMRAKRAKNGYLCVKCDTKVGVDWRNKGVIGCKIGVIRGSIDRYLMSTDMAVPPPPPRSTELSDSFFKN